MHQSAATIAKFTEVQKSYDGETLVIRNLNLDIRRGEFLTLLGPSGSGKTTTLMLLAGFEAPTHGTIWLDGQRINRVPPEKRDIGVVFQNYALFPHMTVAENLAFPLTVRRVPKTEIERRTARALEMVKLTGFAQRRPGQLSGGQQQRVALARALIFEPKLVLRDEPLGALDKQLREQMQLEIKHLHETLRITVVYVTHDQSEALTMSDRIAVFSDGVIQQIATPAELYEQPANAFVAQFIGENNRLRGRVMHVNGVSCTVEVNGGSTIEALTTRVPGLGADTMISLRPERVKINPTDGACANRFQATVAELIYLGDHTRIRCAVCGQDDFIAKVPNTEGISSLAPGAMIEIGWKKEDCLALDPS